MAWSFTLNSCYSLSRLTSSFLLLLHLSITSFQKNKMSALVSFNDHRANYSCAEGLFSALYPIEMKIEDWVPACFSPEAKKGLVQLANDLKGLEMWNERREREGGLPGGLAGRVGLKMTKANLRARIFDERYKEVMRTVKRDLMTRDEPTLRGFWEAMVHCGIATAQTKLTASLREEMSEAEGWAYAGLKEEVMARFCSLMSREAERAMLYKWVPVFPVRERGTGRWYFCLTGITNFLWHTLDDASKQNPRDYYFSDSLSAVRRGGMCGLIDEVLEQHGMDNRYGWWVVERVIKRGEEKVFVGKKLREKPRKAGYIHWARV